MSELYTICQRNVNDPVHRQVRHPVPVHSEPEDKKKELLIKRR